MQAESVMASMDFRQYQLQFSGHIRNPEKQSRPSGVSAKRMRVYTEIVFNNLESSLASCFPVAKKVLGIRAWKKLVRAFFIQHQCRSPIFRKIPEEFLTFLRSAADIPPYLYSLAHYEWMELAVSAQDVTVDMEHVDCERDLLNAQPVFAPALALLSYDYPVHRISPRSRPRQPLTQPVHLLMFRDIDDNVRFIELNPVTASLLNILKAGTATCRQALEQIAIELAHPDPEAVIQYGLDILINLKQQGAILGSKLLPT